MAYKPGAASKKAFSIRLLSDVKSIECGNTNSGEPAVLKITTTDGQVHQIIGGLHLVERLIKKGLKQQVNLELERNLRMKEEDAMRKKGEKQAEKEMQGAHSSLGVNVKQVSIPMGTAAFGGTTVGVASASVVVASLLSSGQVLTGIAIGGVTFSTQVGATLGIGAGGLIGAGLGVGVGLVFAAGLTLHQYLKFTHESGLAAGEKIFEKLRCHSMYRTCATTMIVPADKPCPHEAGSSKGKAPRSKSSSRGRR